MSNSTLNQDHVNTVHLNYFGTKGMTVRPRPTIVIFNVAWVRSMLNVTGFFVKIFVFFVIYIFFLRLANKD